MDGGAPSFFYSPKFKTRGDRCLGCRHQRLRPVRGAAGALSPFRLLHKILGTPLAGMPAPHEDDATAVLVEGKAYPHADKAIAEGNADEITDTNGNAPLEDDANDDGIDGIACGTQGVDGEDIGAAAILEEHIDDEYPEAHGDDFGIAGEKAEDELAREGQDNGTGQRHLHLSVTCPSDICDDTSKKPRGQRTVRRVYDECFFVSVAQRALSRFAPSGAGAQISYGW